MWCNRTSGVAGGQDNDGQPHRVTQRRATARVLARPAAPTTTNILTTVGLIAGLLLLWTMIVAL
jgi:hypothetical protein